MVARKIQCLKDWMTLYFPHFFLVPSPVINYERSLMNKLLLIIESQNLHDGWSQIMH